MFIRSLFPFVILLLTLLQVSSFAVEPYFLGSEPLIRIGLSTNAGSVSITTSDTQLVAFSPEDPGKYLATNRVSVSARAYRPPEVENYRFEIQNIVTVDEANDIAKEVREATGESALVSIDHGDEYMEALDR